MAKTYTLLASALWKDGHAYKRGDTVEFEPERGAELVAHGVLADGKDAPAKEETVEPEVAEEGGTGAAKTSRSAKR